MTDPTPSVSDPEQCVRHACKRRELEMRERIATLESALAEARRDGERLDCALTPRMWTKPMFEAWHRAIPDTVQAFADLRDAAIANQEPSHG